jgi:aspartate aminotransferase-like enzyme
MLNHKRIIIAAAAVALMMPACNRPEPAREQATPATREDAAAEQRKRIDDTAQMEKRVVDLERRWSDMQNKIVEKSSTPTAALRAEVKEDVNNARQAVEDLKTTTPENWWERHEHVMERTAADIEADVRRFTKGQPTASTAVQEPETPVQAAPFESRRDRFVTRLRARVDGMEEQLKTVSARGAQETELEDTRARVTKLKEDVDRLRTSSADDWWDISSKRVTEYIDRVERSIRRLDDDT